MRKIAFFVEGQTEQIFINRLVKEMFGHDGVSIILKRCLGGTNIPKQEIIRHASYAVKPSWQVLITDCGSDNKVKSEILDNIENLSQTGYSCIIGLRDLFPLPVKELPVLEKGLKFLPARYRNYENPFNIVIVVQEIETWFLAETNHFRKVDRKLTGQFINKYLGFNPYTINAMEREHPSKDINHIYQLVGKSYTKRHWQVEKLVNRLDFDHLLRDVKYNIPSLKELVNIIENFKNNR